MNLKPWFPNLLLLLATFIWGFGYIPLKILVGSIPPYELNGIRFGSAGLFLVPFVLYNLKRNNNKSVEEYPNPNPKNTYSFLYAAILLSLLLFSGSAFQTIGIKYTTATNAGFVTGLFVVFTPIFSSLLERRTPGIQLWTSVVLAFLGLALFTLNTDWKINYGDFLVLFCAILSALQIIYTTKYTLSCDPLILTFVQLIFMIFFCGITSLIFESKQWVSPTPRQWIGLLYLAIFASAIAFIIQAYFQRKIETTKAALIYITEPIFVALASFLILHERLKTRQWIGATIILSAMILSEIKFKHTHSRRTFSNGS